MNNNRTETDIEHYGPQYQALLFMILSFSILGFCVMIQNQGGLLTVPFFAMGLLSITLLGIAQEMASKSYRHHSRRYFAHALFLTALSPCLITIYLLLKGDFWRFSNLYYLPKINSLLFAGWLIGSAAVVYVPLRSGVMFIRPSQGKAPVMAFGLMFVGFSLIMPVGFSPDGLKYLFIPGLIVAVLSVVMIYKSFIWKTDKVHVLQIALLCAIATAMSLFALGVSGLFDMHKRTFKIAIIGGDIPKLEKLLSDGYSVNDPSVSFRSPVLAAIHYGYGQRGNDYSRYIWNAPWGSQKERERKVLDIIQVLIKYGADINAPNSQGWTPLMESIRYGMPDVTKFLLERGANVNVITPNGQTILELAMEVLSTKKLLRLLIEKGANPNVQNSSGDTLLYFLIRERDTNSIKVLLEHDVNVNIKNKRGLTPLTEAEMIGQTDIAELLRQHGAKE
jgi:hypothetical protein